MRIIFFLLLLFSFSASAQRQQQRGQLGIRYYTPAIKVDSITTSTGFKLIVTADSIELHSKLYVWSIPSGQPTDSMLTVNTGSNEIRKVPQNPRVLSGSAALDFPNTAAHETSALTITVTGAAAGDCVALGYGLASTLTGHVYTASVTATNTVTVVFLNGSVTANNPGSATFNVRVIK